jgi:multidrug efflux pump subunit AcrB
VISRLNGRPAAGMTVRLAPARTHIRRSTAGQETRHRTRRIVARRHGAVVPRRQHRFIRISIREVIFTLIEAIALVILVMWVFLRTGAPH